jgi:hypothetical protein
MITLLLSLKIQTWVTDYKSTDTAAATRRFSAKSNCNILKRSLPIIREAYNIGENGTIGVRKFLQFFRYAVYFTHYNPGHLQLHMYLGICIT